MKSYVLQVNIRFISLHLLLTWIIAANHFGVICYFVFDAIVHARVPPNQSKICSCPLPLRYHFYFHFIFLIHTGHANFEFN